jgi:D-alanyl-D-alanine carboxypeptidase/D-alanyl-D-alanine-endopeptidase (penicillin-binding protein 4)
VASFRGVVFAVATGVALVAGGGAYVVTHQPDDPAPVASPAPTSPAPPSPKTVAERTPAELVAAPAPGPVATTGGVARVLAKPLNAAALGARVDALVVDATSGTTLYDRGSGVRVVPASTTKLFTAAAALKALGPERRLETRVVASGTVTKGTLHGDLVVVGGGDPTLTAQSGAAAYPQPARLSDLARQVRKAGIRKVSGGVVVNGSIFTGATLAPGWKASYVTEGSVAPLTAFMADGGRLRADDDDRSQRPDVTAGLKLRAALKTAGVAITRADVTRGTAPPTATTVATVQSPPVAALVERLLTRSDNELAESLARHVALARKSTADFAGAAAAVMDTVADLGVERPLLHDASGLSRLDRVTPAQLVALLALATREPALAPLTSGLPVAAFSGTLATRYDEGAATRAAGRVRAKTGSLDNVATLAGIVETRSGRILVFAFAADRLPTKFVGAAARALDVAAAALAGCGCT